MSSAVAEAGRAATIVGAGADPGHAVGVVTGTEVFAALPRAKQCLRRDHRVAGTHRERFLGVDHLSALPVAGGSRRVAETLAGQLIVWLQVLMSTSNQRGLQASASAALHRTRQLAAGQGLLPLRSRRREPVRSEFRCRMVPSFLGRSRLQDHRVQRFQRSRRLTKLPRWKGLWKLWVLCSSKPSGLFALSV